MRREKKPDGTTVLVGQALTALDIYPLGAVYMSLVATDPATLFGGTWARLAKGRVLVGVDENDADFNAPRDTVGAKTVALTEAQLAAHDHPINHDHPAGTTGSSGPHNHDVTRKAGVGTSTGVAQGNATTTSTATTTNDPAHDHPFDVPAFAGNSGSAGGGQAHNNVQPSLAVYIWERTA